MAHFKQETLDSIHDMLDSLNDEQFKKMLKGLNVSQLVELEIAIKKAIDDVRRDLNQE